MRGLLWSTQEDEGLLTLLFRGAAEEPPRPLLLQWLMHHLTTQTSQSNCITRCFQGETLKNCSSDQIEVCLDCASRSTCVDVYTAMLCSHSLNRPPGKGEFVSFIPSTVCVFTASQTSHGWRCWSLCSRHTSHRCALR